MTIEEFERLYSDVDLKFSSYYKYSFYFSGEKDGVTISASYGGNVNDIYRFDVSHDTVKKLGNIKRDWSTVIAIKDDKEIFSYSDY